MVQVLDVEDIGRSRWSQLEDIEAAERGETTKGREIIRVVQPLDDGGGGGPGDRGDGVATGARTTGGGGATRGGGAAGSASTSAGSGNANSFQAISTGPHRLVLQDVNGCRVYGLEVSPVSGVSLSMNIGVKMLLRNVTVARAVLLLDPNCVTILGGKIDNLAKAWREGRKSRLSAGLE